MVGGISNFSALTSGRIYNEMSAQMNHAMLNLTTGKKINRAADDPSGASAVTSLHMDQSRLRSTIKTDERELARLGAIDGAAGGVSELLGELNGLVVTAANSSGLSEEERTGINRQATSLVESINHAADTTTFGDDKQTIISALAAVKIGRVDGASLQDLADGRDLNLFNGDLEKAQKVIAKAVTDVSEFQAGVGTSTKQVESRVRSNLTALEANESTRSLIEDADIAEETSKLMRAQVLRQAAIFAMNMFRSTDSNSMLSLLAPQR